MSSSGKIEYQIVVNDAGVTGKVGQINNSLKTVGTNAKTAATGTGSLNTSLNQVGTTSQTVATKTKGMTSAFGGFKSAISGMAGKGLALSLGIAGVASQIAGIADSYDNLRDTELKLNTMRTATTKSGNIVTGMEIRLAKMRKDGKQGTAEYALLEKKLVTARENQKNKTNNLANAEDDYQRAQRAFYLQIGPQIIGIASQLASSMLLMKTYSGGAAEGMKGMSVASRALGTAMKAIPLVAIAGAILAIRTNAFGFRDALEAVGVKIGQILPGLKPFLDWVHSMAEALGLTGGNLDMGKAFDLLKTGFTGALDTIMNTDWSKVIGDLVNNIAHFLQTADWKEVWKEFQNALFAGGTWIYDRLNEVGKKIVDWFNDIKWDDVWNAFRSAIFAGGSWVYDRLNEVWKKIVDWFTTAKWGDVWKLFITFSPAALLASKLPEIYTAIKDWAKTVDWTGVWKGFQDAFAWTQDVINKAGSALITALKGYFSPTNMAAVGLAVGQGLAGAIDWTVDMINKIGTSFVNALINFFTPAGLSSTGTTIVTNIVDAITRIVKGGEYLVDAITAFAGGFVKGFTPASLSTVGTKISDSIQAFFTVKNLTAVGKALLDAIVGAAKDIKPADVQNFIINIGTEIGKLFTVKNLTYVGLALLKGVVEAAKATGAIVTPVVISIGTEVARLFTAKNLAEVGKRFLTGFVEAVKALPGLLSSLGQWIWEQISGGAGFIGQKIQEAIKSLNQSAEAGGPGGGGTVQNTALLADNTLGKQAMTAMLEYWKRIASDIQGIRPVLFINDITAKAVILAVQEYWKQIGSNIQGIAPVLPLNSEGALALILAVQEYWKQIGGNIQGLVPALSANNTAAIQIMGAVMKTWQSAVSTLAGMKPALSANNTAALAAEKAVEVNWRGYANAISKVIPKITVNNSQALNAIKAVQNAMNSVKNVSRTITITTRYVTVGSPARHNITGIQAHNITGAGQTTAVAPLIGGGNMTNNIVGGGQGDVNVTINMRDEFGIEKQRKFKAVLGKDRYVFGSVGAGG